MTFTDKELVHRLIEITEARMHNHQFGVSKLAQEIGMSRSTLHRKVKRLCHCSISQFICHMRLKKALEILQKQDSHPISNTAVKCGFHSITYFNKCFRDYFGFTPRETRKQLQKG
jgi:AraC-like DNA-binding protein